MVLKSDQERVKTLLSETITLLCRSGLHFELELNVEALIGITIDKEEIFLVNINENIQSNVRVSESLCTSQFPNEQKVENLELCEIYKETAADSSRPLHMPSPAVIVTSNNCSQPALNWVPTADTRSAFAKARLKHCQTVKTTSDHCSKEGENFFSKSSFDVVQNNDDVSLDKETVAEPNVSLISREGLMSNIRNCELKDNQTVRTNDSDKDLDSDIIFIKEETLSAGGEFYGSSAACIQPASIIPEALSETNASENSECTFQMPRFSTCSRKDVLSWGNNSLCDGFSAVKLPRNISRQNSATSVDVSTEKRFYRCQIYGSTIGNLNAYKEHVRRHRNIYKYYCSICGKGFSASINLRGHLVKHTGVKEFHCNVCAKDFVHKQDLKRHLVSVHGQQPQ